MHVGGATVGTKLSEIEENTRIIFHIHHAEQQMDLGGVLKKHLEDNIALITLDYTGPQRLVFENVVIDMEYPQEDGIPLLWSNVKIVNFKRFVKKFRSIFLVEESGKKSSYKEIDCL